MAVPEINELAGKTNAWNWPAEWAVDEKFWREVATRTVAGVLTLIFLGLPGVLYGMSAGVFTTEQAMPIIIGAGILTVVVGGYTVMQVLIRTLTKRGILQTVKDLVSDDAAPMPISFPWGATEFATRFINASSEERANLAALFSQRIQVELLTRAKRQAVWSVSAGVASMIAGLTLPLFPLLK